MGSNADIRRRFSLDVSKLEDKDFIQRNSWWLGENGKHADLRTNFVTIHARRFFCDDPRIDFMERILGVISTALYDTSGIPWTYVESKDIASLLGPSFRVSGPPLQVRQPEELLAQAAGYMLSSNQDEVNYFYQENPLAALTRYVTWSLLTTAAMSCGVTYNYTDPDVTQLITRVGTGIALASTLQLGVDGPHDSQRIHHLVSGYDKHEGNFVNVGVVGAPDSDVDSTSDSVQAVSDGDTESWPAYSNRVMGTLLDYISHGRTGRDLIVPYASRNIVHWGDLEAFTSEPDPVVSDLTID